MELAAGDWQQVLTQQCGLDLLTPAGIKAQSYPSHSCSHTRACTDCLLTCCGDVSSGGANRLNLILYKLHIHLHTFKGAHFWEFSSRTPGTCMQRLEIEPMSFVWSQWSFSCSALFFIHVKWRSNTHFSCIPSNVIVSVSSCLSCFHPKAIGCFLTINM